MTEASDTPPFILERAKDTPARTTSIYPAAHRLPEGKRLKRVLGDLCGLKNFGVNLTTLLPGGASAHRHSHAKQDEFVFIVEGEAVLVVDEGEFVLKAGAAAGFPAGTGNGHHLLNRSNKPVTYLEIGDRTPGEEVLYSDIDMMVRAGEDGQMRFTTKDGTPY